MPKFTFDAALSDSENIERFFNELHAVDPEMAALLKANISGLLPFPSAPEQRAPKRAAINAAVRKVLDQLAEKEKPAK